MVPPSVVVFDVNETLADLTGLRPRFEAVGAPGRLLETWFASVLRDGFALTTAGGYADFKTIAIATLRSMLAGMEGEGLRREPAEAAEYVVAGFPELELHPDVAAGMARLREADLRLVTLTNGGAETTKALLERGGVADLVEQQLSVSEVRRWKPAREAYLLAAERCSSPVEEMAFVAVHPWDIDGAKRAGLAGAWLNRADAPYPEFFEKPDFVAPDLGTLSERLLGA